MMPIKISSAIDQGKSNKNELGNKEIVRECARLDIEKHKQSDYIFSRGMSNQQEFAISQDFATETQVKKQQPTTQPCENHIEENLLEERTTCNDGLIDISDETMIREMQAFSAQVKEFVAFAQESRKRRLRYSVQNEGNDVQVSKPSPKPASFFEKITGYLTTIFHNKSQDNSQDIKSSQHLIRGGQTKVQENVQKIKHKVSSHKTVQFFDKKSK